MDEFLESIKLMEEVVKWSIKSRMYLQSESQMDIEDCAGGWGPY